MKAHSFLSLGLVASIRLGAQTPEATDSTGLPGDHFSLEGALEMFKDNVEMEQFEAALNREENTVNNLDLDGNGEVDYVRVDAQRDGDAAVVVMRVAVSAKEVQDVAVIEIQRTGEESATLQIHGDEDLYPAVTIIEPLEEQEEADARALANVWSWRPVPWFFSPRFIPYASQWRWAQQPPSWKPWHPHPWRHWWGASNHHRAGYRPWNSCRIPQAHAIYAPHRMRSQAVVQRYRSAHERYDATAPPKGGGK